VVSLPPATMGPMRTVETYRWRYVERGRVKTTKFHCSWDGIRYENPEAEPIEGTLILRQEPETPQEGIAFASSGNAGTRVG